MNQALLVIDMQIFIQNRIEKGISFSPKNVITKMVDVLTKFRDSDQLVIHVMHETIPLGSTLHKDSEFYPMMKATKSIIKEPIFIKNTSSAFASTNLESYLKEMNIDKLVVIGGITGFCINSTVRHGSDLGFKMSVVDDAIISFDLPNEGIKGSTIHDVTIALLNSDFAKIINSSQI
ncbi:hypothetical protein P256_02570 [Acinetobacter nectaris CIP 110549]|uniref:Isochorismatase-like domain-containing protein n=1 Tax=Acinetobacter nectaris CIP 110549 TaxID=1392540 RepID=V2T1G4_9GAMM|nr:isochorismatase family protein [Acinetobacter nectaris]ESK36263.1 hypothetical protein P256_02570 [Acinetobacter nectaris CIP 110549]